MKKLLLIGSLIAVCPIAVAMDDPFKQDPFTKDDAGNNALLRAVREAEPNLDVIGSLISRGEERDKNYVNVKNNQGNTALHRLVTKNATPENLQAIRYLVDRGADLNARNKRGQTPLELAIENLQAEAKAQGREYSEPAWINWLRQGATGSINVQEGGRGFLRGVVFGQPKNK